MQVHRSHPSGHWPFIVILDGVAHEETLLCENAEPLSCALVNPGITLLPLDDTFLKRQDYGIKMMTNPAVIQHTSVWRGQVRHQAQHQPQLALPHQGFRRIIVQHGGSGLGRHLPLEVQLAAEPMELRARETRELLLHGLPGHFCRWPISRLHEEPGPGLVQRSQAALLGLVAHCAEETLPRHAPLPHLEHRAEEVKYDCPNWQSCGCGLGGTRCARWPPNIGLCCRCRTHHRNHFC
mmetsp:Transcript_112828/g.364245  ORF Transcript_112828/g.364245 Transcript_112828/m.364245 type:complete len:237 (+) Transcript_112828:265-975(+)